MKILTITLALTFATSGLLTSCNSPGEKVENAKENVKEAEEKEQKAKEELAKAERDSIDDYLKFKSEQEERIRENEKRIAELKEEIKNEKASMRVNYQKQIDTLEARNTRLGMKIHYYNNETKKDWKSFKDEFNHDMEELGKALKDFTVKNTK